MLNLTRFETRIREKGLHVFCVRVLQKGELMGTIDFAEDARRLQHSISKSFTSMAVGMAIEEGKLTLDTKIEDFFPEYTSLQEQAIPALHPKNITVAHLLHMSTGHDAALLSLEERAALKESDWVKHYMSQPLNRPPGQRFIYSSGDTFILSAIIEAAVGQTVKDYLIPRLFAPMGIDNIRWDTSPLGRTLGCTGLYLTTEELSRFGQMLLQKGAWNRQQLVDPQWIEYVTSKQIDTDGTGMWGEGYGGQFWMCSRDVYRADGARGQFCIVAPDREAVIAINSEETDMQAIMDTVWEEIWPLLSV